MASLFLGKLSTTSRTSRGVKGRRIESKIFVGWSHHSITWLTFRLCAIHSPIYCNGPLLHTVQLARIFNDSKTFVDMKLKQNPEITLELFNAFLAEHEGKPDREAVRRFVNVSCGQTIALLLLDSTILSQNHRRLISKGVVWNSLIGYPKIGRKRRNSWDKSKMPTTKGLVMRCIHCGNNWAVKWSMMLL